MESSTEILQNRARRAAHTEGGNETGIPCVTAWRFTTEKIMGGKLEEETMAAADAAVFMAVSRLFPVIEQAPRSEFIRRNISALPILYGRKRPHRSF